MKTTPSGNNDTNPQPLTRRRFIQRTAAASAATVFGLSSLRGLAEEVNPVTKELCYVIITVANDPSSNPPAKYQFDGSDVASGLYPEGSGHQGCADSILAFFRAPGIKPGNNTLHLFDVKEYTMDMDVYTQHFKKTEPFSPKITSSPGVTITDAVDGSGNACRKWSMPKTSNMSITIDYGRVVANT